MTTTRRPLPRRLPGPLVGRNDGHDWRTCPHPDDRIQWRRDELLCRWVGICHRCGIGRTFHRGDEPIVRTDEQLANREVPPIPLLDQAIYTMCPSLGYEPW